MFLNQKNLSRSLTEFGRQGPFDHCIIDEFFKEDVARELEVEFPGFDSDEWHKYNNPIEIKKLCNNWNVFPALTYQVFNYLNSTDFLHILARLLPSDKKLYSDIGLNGGGWHIHKKGGKLNTHLDYSLHPKLGLQRKLNLIIYLNASWERNWGGNLGLWSNESSERPGELIKEIEPKFNRAVLFDTTQNSWHGLPDPIRCPDNEYRKSMAVYYLCEPPIQVDKRSKALFSPTKDQTNDQSVLDLIAKRSNIATASDVYKT